MFLLAISFACQGYKDWQSRAFPAVLFSLNNQHLSMAQTPTHIVCTSVDNQAVNLHSYIL